MRAPAAITTLAVTLAVAASAAPATRAAVGPSTGLYGSPALAARSLPAARGSGPAPGPAILHAPLAHAPQLENAPGSIWHAAPILVSGASAYRDGEFLYQDYLFDDQGAAGDYTYPTGPAYRSDDLADFVELRLKLTPTGTAFRITYNAMTDPRLVATTIALGGSIARVQVPDGANATEPANTFVTVHGTTAQVIDAGSGRARAPLHAAVDRLRRQVVVTVPFADFDPRGQAAVRIAAATGLWDTRGGRYLLPTATATASTPGGAQSASPTAFFNVAFRYDELHQTADGLNVAGLGVGAFGDGGQDQALATGDLSRFHAEVDFRWLAQHRTDQLASRRDGTPQIGAMVRIYASQFDDPQGRGQPSDGTAGCGGSCSWQYGGQLQPYAIYVPKRRPGPQGYGLTIDLHGCNNPYTVGFDDPRMRELAERGHGSIVVTGEARGGCYWYAGQAGADPFEIWDDVAHRYLLNPRQVALTGMSMGGYGTFRLAAMFPDLFAAIAPVIPCPSAGVSWAAGARPPGGESSLLEPMLASLRDVPVIMWISSADQTCVYEHQRALISELRRLGYRYSAWTFSGFSHNAFAVFAESQSQPLATYLGTRAVTQNPARVTYVVNPTFDNRADGLVANHAYWLSDVTVRDPRALGRVDAVSRGLPGSAGAADPATTSRHGTLTGGIVPGPYAAQTLTWRRRPVRPRRPERDELDVTASNIASITVDARRAHLTCHPRIRAQGRVHVRMIDCRAGRR